MAATTHQTARLSTGKHGSPAEGACVMELASMLAGEPFTDAPPSVCPVIRDFLRSYNDRIDDERRQDLYACAAEVVDSRSTAFVETERLRLCAEAARTAYWSWASLPSFPMFPLRGHAAVRAGWALASGRGSEHARALALVDDLVDAGRQARRADEQPSFASEALAPFPVGEGREAVVVADLVT